MTPGARNLITDVDGLLVGNAEDHMLKSGCTVLTSNTPFVAGVHVMGGAPGTRETDLMAPDRLVHHADALVLSGGSSFGLDAASGVADALAAQGRGFQVGDVHVPIVPAAILFDLQNGGDKTWTKNPYNSLGSRALGSAQPEFDLGSVGAGTGCSTHELKGGLGSASLTLDTGVTVGALVAVNAVGSAIGGSPPRFWAAPFEIGNEFGGLGPIDNASETLDATLQPPAPLQRENTTIAIVATDAKLDQAQATRMATTAHTGIARAIVPSHTLFDGDLVFACSTSKIELADILAGQIAIGQAAAVCLSRAIARAVYEARPAVSDKKPTWSQFAN